MSYLETRITREEFIKTREVKRTQDQGKISLNLLDCFCKDQFQKDGDTVVLDISNAVNQDQNHDRMFRFCNTFIQWLLLDHPNITINLGRRIRHMKKHHPNTIKVHIGYLRQFFEIIFWEG